MRLKTILPFILVVLTLSTTHNYAQEKSSEYLIESVDLKELNKYKWKEVAEYFKDFDKKEKITIRMKYSDPLAETERKGKVDNFDTSVSGKARKAKALTQKIETIITTLTNN